MTFIPLICSAISLADEIESLDVEHVVLLGSGLFGAVLVKILKIRGIYVKIIVSENDVKADILKKNGATVTILEENTLLNEVIDPEQEVICLDTNICLELNRKHKDWMNEISFYKFSDLSEEYKCRGIREEAISLMENDEIDVSDLIAQHVHGEYILDTMSLLEKNFFFGKALIYDW